MHERLAQIQKAYLTELKAEVTKVKKWWKARVDDADPKSFPGKPALTFEQRWSVEIGGHPRLLEIFRRHYLAVEAVNAELDGAQAVRPVDLLVNDLQRKHKDLYSVAGMMVLVPVSRKNGVAV